MNTPLYIKTDNSLLTSMITIDKLIEYAKKNKLNALTITDNNMYGALEFYKKCKQNNIKPVIGLEINLETNIVLYCINYKGYKNLIKLATIQSERKNEIKDLEKYSDNLICIVPEESKKYYKDLCKIYNDIYLMNIKEILCLEKQDQKYLKYLKAIKCGQMIEEQDSDNFFDLSTDSLEIIDKCNLEIVMHQDLLPIYSDNAYDDLKKLCIEGLKRIFGKEVKKIYVERLKYELEVIKKLNFCNYFLVVYDYVKYAKDNNILVGPGRGSAAGSLVAYLLNITTIDPIKYDLLFERFLNKERITMPDIDIDFEYNRRWEVIEYCINKYGVKKVAPIITFGTLGSKQVIRDVGRVKEIELKKIDLLCKQIDSKFSLTKNYKQNDKIEKIITMNPELKEVYQIALKFEGLKRHTSIHAAGIIISNKNLDEVIPLEMNHDGFYTTGYSMEYLEEIGLLKMDFLALKNLTLINDVIKQIHGLLFDNIPENDKRALDIFASANTVGIFQFESNGMINFLRKLKPTTFDDIFAAIALYRPGPMQNIDSYIKRKYGKEKIDYIEQALEKILKPTYGIIIYQEQIMQIAQIFANYSLAEADLLRRAMSKKKEEILLKEKENFIKRSIDNGYSKEKATKVYDLIFKFASYGFNKAHSVAYSQIAYKMAYLKAYYPKQFMNSLLLMVIGSDIKTKEYIYECKMNNIKILPLDINKSTNEYVVEEDGIRFPFNNIKGLGTVSSKSILNERKTPFKDIYDFTSKCYPKCLNKKSFENLILIGAFDSLNYTRRTLYENLDNILNYGEIGTYLDELLPKPELDEKPEYTKKELMNFELEIYGFYLSNHPITNYKLKTKSVNINELSNYFDKFVDIVLYVENLKEITTKNNEKMLFITGSDEISIIDVVIFPKTYKTYPNIEKGDILFVRGKVEKRFDKYQIIVNKITKVT